MNNNTSMTCVNESIFSKIKNFFKSIFYKAPKEEPHVEKVEEKVTVEELVEEPKEELKVEIKEEKKGPKSKEEILEIYEKAKLGEYDLRTLSIEEMKILNGLIREEIKIKEELLKKTLASLDA
ncbi:MAG: hypothetical protein IJS47_01755 [Clostridia bacterium]|nr:hypothetical protein [Clostridia bacterium]